jgi:hypothetical protein
MNGRIQLSFSDGVAAVSASIVLLFFIFPLTRELYIRAYRFSPVLLSFIKFAVLATSGELLVNRIETGRYTVKYFGLLPKMLVWGLLGVLIYCSFEIFSAGVTGFFFNGQVPDTMYLRILRAFLISLFLNTLFAPMMMVTHRLTDIFINENEGNFPIRKFNIVDLLEKVNWKSMGGFVLLKTIPFFWIPAHTITFLLPPTFRILFAALLSIALGLLLSGAKKKTA